MKIKRFIIHWLPVALMAGVIFLLSAQPELKSGLQPLYDLVLRKIGHALIFGALTFLTIRALRQVHGYRLSRAVFGALLVTVLYAVSDEYHQLFVFSRHGEPSDVIIDVLGGGVAAWLILKAGGDDGVAA